MEGSWRPERPGEPERPPPPPEPDNRGYGRTALIALGAVAALLVAALWVVALVDVSDSGDDESTDPPASITETDVPAEAPACNPDASFSRRPPPGFTYAKAAPDTVAGLVDDLATSDDAPAWVDESVAGRQVMRGGRRVGIAVSIDAGPDSDPYHYTDGLITLAHQRNHKVTWKDIDLENQYLSILQIDSGSGATRVIVAMSGCRLVAVQGGEERPLRLVLRELLRAG